MPACSLVSTAFPLSKHIAPYWWSLIKPLLWARHCLATGGQSHSQPITHPPTCSYCTVSASWSVPHCTLPSRKLRQMRQPNNFSFLSARISNSKELSRKLNYGYWINSLILSFMSVFCSHRYYLQSEGEIGLKGIIFVIRIKTVESLGLKDGTHLKDRIVIFSFCPFDISRSTND